MQRALAISTLALLLFGCGEAPPDAVARQPESVVAPKTCDVGEIALEGGGCRPAGVPEDACGPGFASDGASGCVAVLPAEPCGAGLMAIPGETACREVAPCGSTWGEIPIEDGTQYVRPTADRKISDGSASAPWQTIEEALDAAAPGAIVALAAGDYHEAVVISWRAVRLWGACPGAVHLTGTLSASITLTVKKGAAGTEIHDLSISGKDLAVAASGSEGILLDRVWIHDTVAAYGLSVEDSLGPTSVTLRRSLIESTRGLGVMVLGSSLTVEDTVIRDVRPQAGTIEAAGMVLDRSKGGGSVTLRSSVIESIVGMGFMQYGGTSSLEGVVIRDTTPAAPQSNARAIHVQADDASGERAAVSVRGSVIERVTEAGIHVAGADATIETMTLRDVAPAPPGNFGAGLGAGINVYCYPELGVQGTATIHDSLIERSTGAGLYLYGGVATVETSAIRDTLPMPDGRYGRGINVQADDEMVFGSSLTLRDAVLERNRDVGIAVLESDAIVERAVIRDTQARMDGSYGDGIAVFVSVPGATSSATITGSRIESSARAGIGSFGANVAIQDDVYECNPIDLDGEALGSPGTFEDLGGNRCGCGDAALECIIQSASLPPPEAI